MESWYKVTVAEEYEKNPQLKEEMVSEMRHWVDNQPHLPHSLADVELIFLIQACDFDLEQAKKALDVNYTVRTKADFFKNRDPTTEEVKNVFDCLQQVYINKVDEEGNHCLMGHLNDLNPAKYNYPVAMRCNAMIMDYMLMEHGSAPGLVVIMDIRGYTLSHLFKVSLREMHNFMLFIQEGSPMKLKAFHIINTAGSIIDKALVIIKPLLNARTAKLMQFHPGYETLYDHGIKRSKIPNEFGGTAGTIKQLSDETLSQIEKNKDFFIGQENYKVDESKRPRTKFFGIF